MTSINHSHQNEDPDEDLDGMIEIQSSDEIPHFANEEAAAEFWAIHSLARHFYTHRGALPGTVLERLQRRAGAQISQDWT